MGKWFFDLSLDELEKVVENIYYSFHNYVNLELPSVKVNSKISWINWINFKQKIYAENNIIIINGSEYFIKNEVYQLNLLPKQNINSYLLQVFLDNIYEKIIRVQTDLILYIKKEDKNYDKRINGLDDADVLTNFPKFLNHIKKDCWNKFFDKQNILNIYNVCKKKISYNYQSVILNFFCKKNLKNCLENVILEKDLDLEKRSALIETIKSFYELFFYEMGENHFNTSNSFFFWSLRKIIENIYLLKNNEKWERGTLSKSIDYFICNLNNFYKKNNNLFGFSLKKMKHITSNKINKIDDFDFLKPFLENVLNTFSHSNYDYDGSESITTKFFNYLSLQEQINKNSKKKDNISICKYIHFLLHDNILMFFDYSDLRNFFREINKKLKDNWNAYLLKQYIDLINSINTYLTEPIKILNKERSVERSYLLIDTDVFETIVGDYINLYLIVDKNKSEKFIMNEIKNKKAIFVDLAKKINKEKVSLIEILDVLKKEKVSFIRFDILDKKNNFILKTPSENDIGKMYFFREKLIEKLLFLIDEDGLTIAKNYFWNYKETNLNNQPLVYKNFWNFYKQILIWYKCIIPIIFSVLVESGLVDETDKTYLFNLFEQDPDK